MLHYITQKLDDAEDTINYQHNLNMNKYRDYVVVSTACSDAKFFLTFSYTGLKEQK